MLFRNSRAGDLLRVAFRSGRVFLDFGHRRRELKLLRGSPRPCIGLNRRLSGLAYASAPSRPLVSSSPAMMTPRWVSAWGKLPSAAPDSGSTISGRRPR